MKTKNGLSSRLQYIVLQVAEHPNRCNPISSEYWIKSHRCATCTKM